MKKYIKIVKASIIFIRGKTNEKKFEEFNNNNWARNEERLEKVSLLSSAKGDEAKFYIFEEYFVGRARAESIGAKCFIL